MTGTQEYPLIVTTPDAFSGRDVSSLCHPGDLVLHRNAFPGPKGLIITRSQRRMLRDLVKDSETLNLSNAEIDQAAQNTHASCYFNNHFCAEMTRPKARKIRWSERLQPGDHLTVRRPVFVDGNRIGGATGRAIAAHANMDALAGLEYPFRELYIFYLWSWGVKKLGIPGLRRRRSVLEVFDKSDTGVCSARYWYWATTAKVGWALTPQEKIAATHYPAELAVSHRFDTICEIRIIAGAGLSIPCRKINADAIPGPAL